MIKMLIFLFRLQRYDIFVIYRNLSVMKHRHHPYSGKKDNTSTEPHRPVLFFTPQKSQRAYRSTSQQGGSDKIGLIGPIGQKTEHRLNPLKPN